MKKIAIVFTLVFSFILSGGFSRTIPSSDAKNIASKFVGRYPKNAYRVADFFELKNGDSVLAYVFNLLPQGYVVISSSTDLSPIPAYSFESNFGVLSSANILSQMLKRDLTAQSQVGPWSSVNAQKWSQLLQPKTNEPKDDFQQWPETGDGWVKTNWTQTAPYSNFCPLDPVTSQRSYTGCPATAMSQILNFHKTTNGTHFDNSDDYYHNYAGRQYHIDDDFAANGFPSFPDLNMYLDTLQMHWSANAALTNNDKAALNFACGVAAQQVFTSEGSGTFSVSQALDAYMRFGCTTAILIQPGDTSLINHLAQNMKDTLPAHLAIQDAAGTSGHNVVVDGYKTNGYFHVNFGWGGQSNGWYLLPQEMPMSLTTFEGVVMDIMKKSPDGISNNERSIMDLRAYPNPFVDNMNLSFNLSVPGEVVIKIWDISGKLVYDKLEKCSISGAQTLHVSDLDCSRGVLFYQVITSNSLYSGKVVKMENN